MNMQQVNLLGSLKHIQTPLLTRFRGLGWFIVLELDALDRVGLLGEFAR